MVNYVGAVVGEAVSLAGLYGAVSLASRHVPLSPKATVLLSLAVTTLTCLGQVLKHKTCSRRSLADERVQKIISVIPHLTLAGAVALKFLSPLGALATAGAMHLYSRISVGVIGLRSLHNTIVQEDSRRW